MPFLIFYIKVGFSFRPKRKEKEESPYTFFSKHTSPTPFMPVEDAGDDRCLAVAEAGVEPAGGSVLFVGIHAQHGAAVFQRVFFIEIHEF